MHSGKVPGFIRIFINQERLKFVSIVYHTEIPGLIRIFFNPGYFKIIRDTFAKIPRFIWIFFEPGDIEVIKILHFTKIQGLSGYLSTQEISK